MVVCGTVFICTEEGRKYTGKDTSYAMTRHCKLLEDCEVQSI